jgi:hypothetical protein
MMKKIVLISALALLTALSSCGIFHKNCNCPHFGKVKSTIKTGQQAV